MSFLNSINGVVPDFNRAMRGANMPGNSNAAFVYVGRAPAPITPNNAPARLLGSGVTPVQRIYADMIRTTNLMGAKPEGMPWQSRLLG